MGLFGGASGVKQAKPPVYTCLQIQTSAQGLPIPILWGANRISGNVIDYFGFKKHDSSKGKGGKGGGNYNYTASVMMGLCEGASDGYTITVGRIWSGQSETTLPGLGGGVFPGTADQAAWSVAAANPPGHTLSYAYTCYYAHENMDLGSSATVPNINFELFSTFNGKNVNNAVNSLPDANFGDIIPDLLTNPRYTLNFPASYLSGFDTLTRYHLAAGIFVSPLLKDAEQTLSILQRWATVGNFWIFWSGTQLKVVCLGDTQISANGVTYTPNTTPIYDLGPDDFCVADKSSNKNEPRIIVTRKDPADGYNQVQLNCSVRTTGTGSHAPTYQDTPFRWRDQVSIDHIGVQAPNVISSTEICNPGTAAAVVALIGQRQQYIRNDYAFKLTSNFFLLEPGDIVTLTDPILGFNRLPVRIKTIEEDDKDVLSLTAEEFVYGVGTASIQNYEPWGGAAPFDTGVSPGSVNSPAFIQPSLSLTQNQSQVWAALSGGANWGGCGVFLSFDGANYSQIGQVATPSLQGTLTAPLPSASGLDTTHTLAIDLTESVGSLDSGATDADADAYRTLVLVDNELMAYGNVSPTGAYTSNLTYLQRGLYGTAPASHAIGAPFSRIDSTKVFAYDLPAANLGQTLYFKFPSVNVFENSAQSLSDCVEYSFTPGLGVPENVQVSYSYGSLTSGSGPKNVVVSWDEQANLSTGYSNLRWSAHPAGTPGQTYGTLSVVATPSNTATLSNAELTGSGDGYAYIDVQSTISTGASSSAWSADSNAPVPTIASAVNQYGVDGSFQGIAVTITPPSGATPTGYVLYASNVGAGVLYNPFASVTLGASNTSYLFTAAQLAGSSNPSNNGVAVQAIYGTQASVASPVTVATGSGPKPNLVSSISGTVNSDNSVSLSWTPPSGTYAPTYYEVYEKFPGGGVSSLSTPAPSSVYHSPSFGTLTGATVFSVVSYNSNGTSDTFSGGFPASSANVTLTLIG